MTMNHVKVILAFLGLTVTNSAQDINKTANSIFM